MNSRDPLPRCQLAKLTTPIGAQLPPAYLSSFQEPILKHKVCRIEGADYWALGGSSSSGWSNRKLAASSSFLSHAK